MLVFVSGSASSRGRGGREGGREGRGQEAEGEHGLRQEDGAAVGGIHGSRRRGRHRLYIR